MKTIHLLLLSFSLIFTSTALSDVETPRFFDQGGISTVVNNPVTIPGSPFDYHPTAEGSTFNMMSITASVNTELACDGIKFDDVIGKFKNDSEQIYKYIQGNWQSLSANYIIFSQPQLAALFENLNDAMTIAIDGSIATCQGMRANAKARNSKEWDAYKLQSDCINKNGGSQVSCLEGNKTDAVNNAILSARASLNNWVSTNSQGKVDPKNSDDSQSVDQLDATCGIGDVSKSVCDKIREVIPQMHNKDGGLKVSYEQPEKSIPEFIGDMKSEIKDEILSYMNATSSAMKKTHNSKLYELSFGAAIMNPIQAKKLQAVYSSGKSLIYETYVDRLSSLWAYRGTRRLFSKAKFGIEDGIAKGDKDQAIILDTKMLAMVVARENYLKSIEEDYKISVMEDRIWDSLDKYQ